MLSPDLLLDEDVRRDPFPVFRALRAESPVCFSERMRTWFVFRYEDCAALLRDRRLSSEWTERWASTLPPVVQEPMAPFLRSFGLWTLQRDPPSHTRLRGLMTRAFTPRMAERLRPRIVGLVEELLRDADPAAGIDVMRDLAGPLPVTVIAELLGADVRDRAELKRWSDDIAGFLASGRGIVTRAEAARRSWERLSEYLRGLIALRREAPADDLVSALIAAEDRGEVLSDDELVAQCISLLFAGHETTTGLIGNGILALLRQPQARAELGDPGPELAAAATHELLRFDGPVQSLRRVALEDVSVRGQQLRRDDSVFLMISAANRDEAEFPDPDRLVWDRQPNHHLAFGLGHHYCLGASLAVLEARIAIAAFLRLVDAPVLDTEQVQWNDTFGLRAPRALPVRGGLAAPGGSTGGGLAQTVSG